MYCLIQILRQLVKQDAAGLAAVGALLPPTKPNIKRCKICREK